jgi:transcription elongation factor GreB
MSPLARALMRSSSGDRVVLHAPTKIEQLEILDVEYAPIPMDPFREPPGAEAPPRPSETSLTPRAASREGRPRE